MSIEQDDINVGFGVQLGGLVTGMQEAVGVVKESSESITQAFEGIHSSMLKLSVAVAGGEAFKEFVADTIESAMGAKKLSEMLGTTAEEAGALDTQLKLAGIGVDQYTGMSMRMARQIKNNEDGLREMGLEVRDSSGSLKSMNQIMSDGASLLNSYKAGIDRNMAAMSLFGRNVGDVQKLILMQTLEEKAKRDEEELGLEVTSKNIAMAMDYKVAVAELKLTFEGVSKAIGDAMLPGLIEMANAFREYGPQAIAVVREAMNAFVVVSGQVKDSIKEVVSIIGSLLSDVSDMFSAVFGESSETSRSLNVFKTVLESVGFVVITVVQTVKQSLRDLQFAVEGTGHLIAAAALKLNPFASRAAFEEAAIGYNEVARKYTADMARYAEEANKSMEKLFAGFKAPEKEEAKPFKGGKEFGGDEAVDAEEGYMAQFEAQWQRKKLIYENTNNLLKVSKDVEADFWMSSLKYVQQSEDFDSTYQQIVRKMVQARLEARHEEIADEQKILQMRADGERKAAQDSVAYRKEELDSKFKLGMISKEEELQALIDFNQKAYAEEVKALNDKFALIAQDPVKREEINQKILDAQRKHNLEMLKLNTELAQEQNATWDASMKAFESTFNYSMQNLISRRMSFKQALGSISMSIGNSMIQEEVTKPLMQYIKGQAAKTAAAQTGAAERAAAEESGGIAGLAAQAGSIIKSIMNYASETFAGVWAALSGVPVVGPAMAAAQAPAAMAAVAGMAGSVASSAGGDWMIPRERMNIVHPRETILPADKATKLDTMLESGAKGHTFNFNVSAADSQDVMRLFNNNKSALMKALSTALRNGSVLKPT